MSTPLQLRTQSEDGRQVVIVAGEVDMESSPRLLSAIHAGLQPGAPLYVDLADVSYIDSSGIAVLVQGLRAAGRRQQSFGLRRPSKKVLAVLRLAQLLELFGIDDGNRNG